MVTKSLETFSSSSAIVLQMMESNKSITRKVLIWCLALGLLYACIFASAHSPSTEDESEEVAGKQDNKLLILMLDGFRWDYYERQKHELRGFRLLLQEGVHAEWVDPIFPSISYPAWTTISTGVYPESHGIIGNYMFDLKYDDVFDFQNATSTSKIHWWQNAEPLWTTATRYSKKTFLRFWSRCDVPYNEISPEKCSAYRDAPGVASIRDTLGQAVDHLQKNFDLAMVYGEHLDNVGHIYGPDSEELKQAMRDVDEVIYDFLDRMTDTGLDEKVNVIIVSDHGMKWVGEGSGTVYISLGDYVDKNEVYKVLGNGAVVAIAPYARYVEQVYEKLQGKEDFDVYKRDDIPEEFHYKRHRLVQDLLVVAKPNVYIMGLQSSKQIPRESHNSKIEGIHGYSNMTDMRTIFFAKGPDFKKGVKHLPISLADEYQIFIELLHIPSQPHNGTWSKVSGMLINTAWNVTQSKFLIIMFQITVFLSTYFVIQ